MIMTTPWQELISLFSKGGAYVIKFRLILPGVNEDTT